MRRLFNAPTAAFLSLLVALVALLSVSACSSAPTGPQTAPNLTCLDTTLTTFTYVPCPRH